MRQATTGDTVKVHYTGTLDDGTQFDSSGGRPPLEVTIGSGQVIPGFEEALVGMAEGETKNVTVEPEGAYGPHHDQLVQTVERERIPSEIELEVGTLLQATDASGNQIRLQVVDFGDDTVTLDGNHPLAGKPLTFQVQLVGFVS